MPESNVIHRGPFVNLTWLDPWIDPGPLEVSGTRMLVLDTLGLVDWEPGHPWIRLFDNTSQGDLLRPGPNSLAIPQQFL